MACMQTLVRLMTVRRHGDHVADLEQGVTDLYNQQGIDKTCASLGKFIEVDRKTGRIIQQRSSPATSYSMFVKINMHAVFRSIFRTTRRNAPETDKGDEKSGSAQQDDVYKSCATPVSALSKSIQAFSIDRKVLSVSPSLSFMSILDLMPLPVTKPEERALAVSILSTRISTPVRSRTTRLASPNSMSSPGTPSFTGSAASTTLNTPPSWREPAFRSPRRIMRSTPFLEQCAKFTNAPPSHTSIDLSFTSTCNPDEGYGIFEHYEEQKRWTEFAFPTGRRNGRFLIAEEEGRRNEDNTTFSDFVDGLSSEHDDVSCAPVGNVFVFSDSPWDNGEQESYGMKGKTSWIREMESLDFTDGQPWFDIELTTR